MKKTMIFQSTIFRIVAIIIALVLPINIMTLVLSNMVLQNNREQTTKEIQSTLEMSAANLKDILRRSSRKLIFLSYDDSNFLELSNKPLEVSESGRALAEVKDALKKVQQDYSWVDLMYFYFPANEFTIMAGYPGISQSLCREFIEQEIDGELSQGWNWKNIVLDDTSTLFGISKWSGSVFGAVINLERTLDKLNLAEYPEGRCVFFTNQKGEIYTKAGAEYIEAQGKTLAELEKSRKYEVFYSDLPDYDLRLVEVVEWSKLNENLPATIIWMQILSIATTLLVIPLLLWYVRQWISKPLNQLVKAIERIEQGDLEYRIETGKQGREFEQINHSFNDMMEQVKDLKIDVYEKELERKNIKMRYLSQQIQPHFILNAMNILYSYEPEEYPLIQKMILCISRYFRYVVKVNAEFVELSQEMDHIKNYFEIQKARFPGMFFSIVEYEEGLRKALIPPLLIQNFAENSIKHSLKIGNKVTIFVIAEYYMGEDGVQRMRIRLADTGEGISDEILEKIRIFQETGEPQEGLGVGIQNSIERLKYLYSEKTSIRFWRDENYSGTNVEIILPIHFEGEEGERGHESVVDR